MRQRHQSMEANNIWKMVSMGVAGCGWSSLTSSFFRGHLDITNSLTFVEMHSLTAQAGSKIYVLTIWQRQNFAPCEGTGMGIRPVPCLGSNPSSPICSGTSAEMVPSSAPVACEFPSWSLNLGTSLPYFSHSSKFSDPHFLHSPSLPTPEPINWKKDRKG